VAGSLLISIASGRKEPNEWNGYTATIAILDELSDYFTTDPVEQNTKL